MHRLLILTAETGGGHRSAAAAIARGMEDLMGGEIAVRVACPLEEAHPILRAMGRLYNRLLRRPGWMPLYFRFLNAARPDRLMWGLARRWFHALVEEVGPDLVVSVHPMVNAGVQPLLREMGRGALPFVVVVTDPGGGTWRGWACPEADLTLVPSERAREQLLAWGVAPGNARVVGMPVHPRFLEPAGRGRAELAAEFGLRPDAFILLLNGGLMGNRNLLRIYRELFLRDDLGLGIFFLAGRDRGLGRRVAALAARGRVPTVTLPFTDRMPDLLALADAMVTKAGGLTTYEALAREVPLIVENLGGPMPQEADTVEAVRQHGLGFVADRISDVAGQVDQLVRDRALVATIKANMRRHANREATSRICSELKARL